MRVTAANIRTWCRTINNSPIWLSALVQDVELRWPTLQAGIIWSGAYDRHALMFVAMAMPHINKCVTVRLHG